MKSLWVMKGINNILRGFFLCCFSSANEKCFSLFFKVAFPFVDVVFVLRWSSVFMCISHFLIISMDCDFLSAQDMSSTSSQDVKEQFSPRFSTYW